MGDCLRYIVRGGGQWKRPKNSKKDRKIALLTSIYFICTMYENPGGGHAPCRCLWLHTVPQELGMHPHPVEKNFGHNGLD